jgi:acyl-CoA synthetase (AMP-forming)/AMP-acid ligase II
MPLYHSSAAVLGFITTITAGTTFALGRKFSTKTFWPEVRASKATVIQYVGETCRYLLTAPPQIDPVTGENLDAKNDVRVAFGNGLRPDIWNKFKERFDVPIIAEFYSATEGAAGTWNYSVNDFSRGAIGRSGSISKLIFGGGSTIVKLDHETDLPYRDPKTGFCEVVPAGDPGELLYSLDPLDIEKKFQGYFNNKNATSSKVMRDVLKKGDAFFRTGDLVRSDTDGRTYFHDRIGDTFRWKSENVSTNEVSEALGLHPSVHEANVYGVELPHHDGRAGCVALLLAEAPSAKLMNELAAHAQKTLPRFAVPLFLRMTSGDDNKTGTNKQQKHVLRAQGVEPVKAGSDALFWLKDGSYVPFTDKEWQELSAGRVKL